jgi:hypothetical protein
MSRTATLGGGANGLSFPTKTCTEVQVIGDIRAYGTLNIDGDGNVSDPHMDAEWGSYQSDEFHCRDCGEEFTNEKAAKEHLRQAQRITDFWLMGLPEASHRNVSLPDFNEEPEEITLNGCSVSIRKGPAHSLALIEDGYEKMIEQSIEVGRIPPEFQFDDWGKLTSKKSPLTYFDCSPRISKRLLARAVKHLAAGAGATYDPEQFMLYRGRDPEGLFTLVANGNALIIASRVQE